MSDDIVNRLRRHQHMGLACTWCEAADEIERLRDGLRLAWTAIERSTPAYVDDVRWVLDFVKPQLMALIEDGDDG